MSTIIGCTHLIKHKKFKAKRSKASGKYKHRNKALPYLGYATYEEYLKSPQWLEIRERVLKKYPNCSCCDKTASQVHHYSYNSPIMLGLLDDLLFSICDKCHLEIEFDENQKRTLKETQKTLCKFLNPKDIKRLAKGLIKLSKYPKDHIQGGTPSKKQIKKLGDSYRERSKNNFNDTNR